MSADGPRTRTIRTDALARVEGEGAMHVRIREGEVEAVQLRIYEPPRFFEALLRGRRHTEPPDITARICGICPVAYQMSACAAIEDACGVTVDEPIRELRRLIYCGEWIESHTLHVFMLHGPDFLGYESVVEMSREHRGVVERGLRMKKAGNEIINLVGGREVHPVNVRVGGFFRAPAKRELRERLERLKEARALALETVRWAGALDFPELEADYEFVALSQPGD
jgi:coenzyme F420-reducing hydrogenase alpha subunit